MGCWGHGDDEAGGKQNSKKNTTYLQGRAGGGGGIDATVDYLDDGCALRAILTRLLCVFLTMPTSTLPRTHKAVDLACPLAG